jgi:hypothetical protein
LIKDSIEGRYNHYRDDAAFFTNSGKMPNPEKKGAEIVTDYRRV